MMKRGENFQTQKESRIPPYTATNDIDLNETRAWSKSKLRDGGGPADRDDRDY